MNITQLSVFLENKPGRLQHILQVLAAKAINLQNLTVAELSDFGILRLIVDRPEEAFAALRAEQITCTKTEVLAVVVDDNPGTLCKLIDSFSHRQINIEYLYSFASHQQADPIMIFRFENLAAAQAALQEEGYAVLPRAEIQGE